MALQQRKLGRHGPMVSALGLGCMGMSEFYGATDDAESLRVLLYAAERGVSFFDTANIYGFGRNEALLARFLKQWRQPVVVATKGGIVRKENSYERRIDNSPAYIRGAVEDSLKRLGLERIDLYYIHRNEEGRAIEEVIETLAALVREGKIAHIGLSEVSVANLRRAAKVHHVAAVQSEYSLWSREPEDGMLAACAELGTAFVPYSPLGRGFLSGQFEDAAALPDGDFRKSNPRFQAEALARNQAALAGFKQLATEQNATPAQLALAWVLARGEHLIPIPGTKRQSYLEQNLGALDIALDAADLAAIEAILPRGFATGARYTPEGFKGTQADEG